MALPRRVKGIIKAAQHLRHQKHMGTVHANASSAHNIARHSAVAQFDEVRPATAKAIAKILATPAGSG